jgi:hypothetical protein
MVTALRILEDNLLENIGVATPCDEDWEKMTGDQRVRHCARCKLNVYNLFAMSREEATALIRERENGRLCIRLLRRADGTVITRDCVELLRAARQRGLATYACVAAIATITQILAHACGGSLLPTLGAMATPRPQHVMMGDVLPQRPPPPPLMGKVASAPSSTPTPRPQANGDKPR